LVLITLKNFHNIMKKTFAGYINLKPLNGIIYPSSQQNIMMKSYIENELNGVFYLSPTEVLQAKFPITLNTLTSKDTKVSGIVMLSTFLLPSSFNQRQEFYKQLLNTKRTAHFIFDEIILKTKDDIEVVEDFIIFNSDHFTKTKKKLSDYEINIAKKYNKITFV
tara:strand:+ start:245 stop:736 length:492 start_codon:yes stop_codon:yes gene_type:complete